MGALSGLSKAEAREKIARDTQHALVRRLKEREPDIFESRIWQRDINHRAMPRYKRYPRM